MSALTSPRLAAVLLFFIAIAPRLPGLDRFLISDEKTNIFLAGSDVIAAVLNGDLRGTYWHFYPGVTMSWLDALGMGGQYLLDLIFGTTSLPFSAYIYDDIFNLVVANRLPYAILTAAAVPAFYLLSRQLLPNRVALLGALFMALDPFFLAHSRVAHGDAPVAVFMSLSALTFFIYGQEIRQGLLGQEQRLAGMQVSDTHAPSVARIVRRSFVGALRQPYLLASAILGSLAALTKAPGQFMALFIIGMSLFYAILQIRPARGNRPASAAYPASSSVIQWGMAIAAWGFIALITFIILWPSMWIDPLGTFRQMWEETFGKVNEGHLVYFFGQPTLDPGPWFYSYIIPFRLTPIIFIGVFLSLLGFIPYVQPAPTAPSGIRHPGSTKVDPTALEGAKSLFPSTLLLLWIFTISLLLFGNLSPKKQDRYLLPLFPFLNLLAAIGWFGLLSLLLDYRPIATALAAVNARFLKADFQTTGFKVLLACILLLLHSLPVLTYYPYYLTYFNPLMGGPARATETTLMGWGEGMEQVAAYLNAKPNAESLVVASTPSQSLLPYFAGTGENFYTNDVAFRADYVVLYLAQMQRLAPSPEIVRYFEAQQPEKIIDIKGVSYAKIYPGPKFILTDIPPEAMPGNVGLGDLMRLAGYNVAATQSSTVDLTLYWHALAALPENYTISVRIRSADGQLLAQQDQWPVDGLLPTSQWRQGDVVVDRHTLEIAGGDSSTATHIEVVVYQADSGETLGPPVSIPIE